MTDSDTHRQPRAVPPAPASFEWFHAPFGLALHCTALAGFRHVFTTRALTLRGEAADDDWAALERTMLVGSRRLFAARQVHGADVLVIDGDGVAPRSLNDRERPHADILVSDRPDSAVAVQAADCVPLLFADRRVGVVAAAHAGWRGTAAGVARRTVEALASHYGSRPADLIVATGPSIGPCCYQVGRDVRDRFEAAGHDRELIAQWFEREAAGERFTLDVARANRDQLAAAGVLASNIAVCGLCTSCHPGLFFSYRRDGAGTGRLAAAIGPSASCRAAL